MSLQLFEPLDDTDCWIIHKPAEIDPAWRLAQALEKHKLPPASERTRRIVGSTGSRLEFLTQLIPSGDYLDFSSQSLSNHLQAANRHTQLRELILGALKALESEIDHTKIFIREYAWDENVRRTTDDCYAVIFDACGGHYEMGWETYRLSIHRPLPQGCQVSADSVSSVRRRIIRAGKAIAQQEDYGSDLETRVTFNVKEKVEAFERAVTTCLSIETRGIATNVVTVGKTLDIVDGKVDILVSELRKSVAAVQTLEDSLRNAADIPDLSFYVP
ncbi:hypothetical protein B0H66DRAFT_528557 [Apodospora peruviana]|uniref:Uncharacterized protein n=1 Tax=Apodospora peruviana TaxID=516989 RepID=A0AAE0ITX2_9PEZI|nr:hypothetical protein B0H66DRAFT_528557 [Apodospora peruviana]